MEKVKERDGFSLVEMIIIIAIVGKSKRKI